MDQFYEERREHERRQWEAAVKGNEEYYEILDRKTRNYYNNY